MVEELSVEFGVLGFRVQGLGHLEVEAVIGRSIELPGIVGQGPRDIAVTKKATCCGCSVNGDESSRV